MKRIYAFISATVYATCILTPSLSFSQFSGNRLCVLQIGDGVGTLTNTGNPIILREFDTNGSPSYSFAVPTSGPNAIILSGTATYEGLLSLGSGMANNNKVAFGGYFASLPSTTVLPSSPSSIVNRAIATLDFLGTYSFVSTSNTYFNGNTIRSAATDGGVNFWGSGSSDGTNYFGNTTGPQNIQSAKTDQNAVSIFNNQLYFSSSSSAGTPTNLGIYSVGLGWPTYPPQSISNVINTGTGSMPMQFYFNTSASPSVCYIADARPGSGGGVQKWVYSSGWNLAYTIPTSSTTQGAIGVVADFSTANPVVYATTIEGANNRLVKIVDIGASSSATTIATSANNTIFRGLSWTPCMATNVSNITGWGTICTGETLSLSVSPGGSPPFSYVWTGPGSFNSNIIANPVVTNPSTGDYSVTVTGGCGTASAYVSVTVSPGPTVGIISTTNTVCSGQTATLIGTGAGSYTWNTGAVAPMIIVIPTVTTTYTITGSNGGCTSTAVFTQSVVSCISVKTNTQASIKFSIYPNPANLSILIKTNSSLNSDIKIVDAVGKVVLVVNNYTSNDPINISVLSKGVYFVSIKQGNFQSGVQKLVID